LTLRTHAEDFGSYSMKTSAGRPLLVCLLAVMVDYMGVSMMRTLLPFRAKALAGDQSAMLIGLLEASYGEGEQMRERSCDFHMHEAKGCSNYGIIRPESVPHKPKTRLVSQTTG
jgi:hypothetical protein